MGKRRLTSRQIARQKELQAKRLTKAAPPSPAMGLFDTLNQNLSPEQPGLLIAHYGTTLIVENQAGQLFRCGLRQNLGTLVTGDEIVWQQIDEHTGIVVAGLPRRSVIYKKDRHSTKPIVANVDHLAIVAALEPFPQPTTLDRYLVLAETFEILPIIIINKWDLFTRQKDQLKLAENLAAYERLGYPCVKVSTETNFGLEILRQALQNHTSIFVGQSGVGKSSLLKALIPETQVAIRELSEIQRQGRHTTTASRLYHLPTGGSLIDSPGIHQFNLDHFSKKAITQSFREFLPFLGNCKFRNCHHTHEIGCALLAAIKQSKIAPFRLENYHTIMTDSVRHK